MNLPAPSEDEAVPSEEILSETKVIAETPIMVATEAPAEAPEPVKHVPTCVYFVCDVEYSVQLYSLHSL
jgi:hypothetical protein